MKKLAIILMMLLYPAVVSSSPWLVCDPQPNVDEHVVVMDGVATIVPYEERDFEGKTYAVLLDLEGIADGVHSVTVAARNAFEEVMELDENGDPVPFVFTWTGLNAPAGIRLVK